MNKLLPKSTVISEQDGFLSVLVQLEPDLYWFNKGPAEGPETYLPGVAMLTWVDYFSRKYKLAEGHMENVRQLKFSVPFIPNDEIRLEIRKVPEGQLAFCAYVKREGGWILGSQGKVRYVEFQSS